MSRVNQARDSQALNFGVNSANSQKAGQGVGALSATAAGPPPTATTAYTGVGANDLAGQMIITNTNAVWTSGSPIYGTILSNTTGATSVVTVDGWWKCADNTSAGTNPASTASYVILPVQAPFWVMGLTNNVSSIAGTETGTAPGGTEYNASGLIRTICTTFTHSAGASTGTLALTFTFTGAASQTIGASFLSNSQTTSGSTGRGNFMFFDDQLNGATGYVVASNGDTLQVTYTITYCTVP